MSEPAEDERQAALQTLEYARGYAAAWTAWNACATVPNPRDREFLDRSRVQVGERRSEAVKVLRELQQEIPANAENARLREALIALLDDAEVHDFGEWLEARMKQARAALAGEVKP